MATKKAVTKKTQPKKAAPAKIAPKKDAAKSLDDLFEDCLKDALWAETAVKDALPKVIKNASSKYLKKVLTIHLAETKDQIKVLNQIFNFYVGIDFKCRFYHLYPVYWATDLWF